MQTIRYPSSNVCVSGANVPPVDAVDESQVQQTDNETTVQVKGDEVTVKGGLIWRVYGDRVDQKFWGLQSVKLPPGKYYVVGCTPDKKFLLKPTEVTVNPIEVGSVSVVLGNEVKVVTVYSNGSYLVDSQPCDNCFQGQAITTKGQVKVLSYTVQLLDGTVTTSIDKPSPDNPPVTASLVLEAELPVYANGAVVATRPEKLTVNLKYDRVPYVRITEGGSKIEVDPALYALKGSTLRVTFTCPETGQTAQAEVEVSDKQVFNTLELYSKTGVKGALCDIDAKLVGSNGEIIAEDSAPFTYIPSVDETGIVLSESSVDAGPFPAKVIVKGCIGNKSARKEYIAYGTFNPLSYHAVLPPKYETSQEVTVEIYTRGGIVASNKYSNVNAPKPAKVLLYDVDGSELQESGSYAAMVGKVKVCADPFALVETAAGEVIVDSNPETDRVEFGDREIPVVRSCAWVDLGNSSYMRVSAANVSKSITLKPIRVKVQGVYKCGNKLAVEMSNVSSGLVSINVSGTAVDGSPINVSSIINLSVQPKSDTSVDVTLERVPKELSASLGYWVTDGQSLYQIVKGPLKLDSECKCVKTDGLHLTLDPQCVLTRVSVEQSVDEDKVQCYKVCNPADVPISVTVNDEELKPGKCKCVYTNSILIKCLDQELAPKLKALTGSVHVDDEKIVVEAFPPKGFVRLYINPVDCYSGDASSVTLTVDLNPSKPEITKQEVATLLQQKGCLPRRVVISGDTSAVWEYQLMVYGSFDDGTAKPCIGKVCGTFVLKCPTGELVYPKDIDKVNVPCDLYAKFGDSEVYVGRPYVSVFVSGNDVVVETYPLYFGSVQVVVTALVDNKNQMTEEVVAQYPVQIPTEVDVKQFKLPENTVAVAAVALRNNEVVLGDYAVVREVRRVDFEEDGVVKVYIVATSDTPIPVLVVGVTDNGEQYELYSDSFVGVYAKEFDISFDQFARQYGKRLARVKVMVGNKVWWYDVEGVQQQPSLGELASSPPVITGIVALLRRILP